FGLGHLLAWCIGEPMDGFSPPYQWVLRLGVMLVFLVGLLILRHVLDKMFNTWIATLTVLSIVAGTNLLDQGLTGQAMPHLTLFCFYSIILYLTYYWRSTSERRYILPLALALGMTTLVRPT